LAACDGRITPIKFHTLPNGQQPSPFCMVMHISRNTQTEACARKDTPTQKKKKKGPMDKPCGSANIINQPFEHSIPFARSQRWFSNSYFVLPPIDQASFNSCLTGKIINIYINDMTRLFSVCELRWVVFPLT
jgi:hypothetical protein